MSMFSNLVEAVVNEIKYSEFKRKQASITKLFPSFFQRVRAVADAGGVDAKLSVQTPDTWMFKVASASKEGGDYAVWFHFTNIPEMLEKWVPVKSLWKKDGSGPDHTLLAQEILNEVDMQSDCDCAADTYWGSEYIKTQKKAQYGGDETRPPVKRNPKQYGILCKHAQLVWSVLPRWLGTFSNHLKRYWKDEIEDIVKRVLDAEKPKQVKNPVEAKPIAGEKPIAKKEAEAGKKPVPQQKQKGEPMKPNQKTADREEMRSNAEDIEEE